MNKTCSAYWSRLSCRRRGLTKNVGHIQPGPPCLSTRAWAAKNFAIATYWTLQRDGVRPFEGRWHKHRPEGLAWFLHNPMLIRNFVRSFCPKDSIKMVIRALIFVSVQTTVIFAAVVLYGLAS